MSEPSALALDPSPPGSHRPAVVDPLEGTPYRTIGRIGRGGMGVVLEAEHRRLGSRVVVKVLHAHLAGSADLVDRMHLEARALAAVGAHPNVVAVLDGGTTREGLPYIVMERLVGHTLGVERRRRGRLPWGEAILWTQQMLAALGAVHAAGIVHRDIKPANLFLCDASPGASRTQSLSMGPQAAPNPGALRTLKLLDFGVAKIMASGAGPQPPGRALATEQTALVGTPAYVAPEQAVGGVLDARTDLYAVGVVLFELLTGRTPFEHHTDVMDLLRAQVTELPRAPSAMGGDQVPAELDRVVLKALAKRPGERFQDAASFSEELRRIGETLGTPTAPEVVTPRPPLLPHKQHPPPRPLALATVWLVSMAVTVGVGLLATEVFR